MSLENPIAYEAALRRLIDLRFQAETRGEFSREAEELEQAIYEMIRRRPNPLPAEDSQESTSYESVLA